MELEDFEKAAIAAMSDENPLPIIITIADAWFVVSAIQLAVRHPDLHEPLRDRLRDIAHQFTEPICADHPSAREAIEMGWHEENDDLLDDGSDIPW